MASNPYQWFYIPNNWMAAMQQHANGSAAAAYRNLQSFPIIPGQGIPTTGTNPTSAAVGAPGGRPPSKAATGTNTKEEPHGTRPEAPSPTQLLPDSNESASTRIAMSRKRQYERWVQVGTPVSRQSIGSALRETLPSRPDKCKCQGHNCLSAKDCPCLAKGIYCGIHCIDCQNQPSHANERYTAITEQLDNIDAIGEPQEANRSIPLVVHGHVVPGVAFGVSTPRVSPPVPPTKRPRRPLLPVILPKQPGETDLEMQRRAEYRRMAWVFSEVELRLSQEKAKDNDAIGHAATDIQTQLEEMATAAKAVKVDVLTHLRTNKRIDPERVYTDDRDIDETFGCQEKLEVCESKDVDRANMKEMAVRAAQDTVMMQALARFVSEMARSIVNDTGDKK